MATKHTHSEAIPERQRASTFKQFSHPMPAVAASSQGAVYGQPDGRYQVRFRMGETVGGLTLAQATARLSAGATQLMSGFDRLMGEIRVYLEFVAIARGEEA